MRLFSLTVARNEADRYLLSMLNAVTRLVDESFLFDDSSTDGTVRAAEHFGCKVGLRREETTTFLQSEGGFRQAAWTSFEHLCAPEEGDWVLAIDADEIVVGPNLVEALRYELPRMAMEQGCDSVVFPIAEVFDIVDGHPQVRTDGYWDSISAPRLFAYHQGGQFEDKKMACGSAPTYVSKCQKMTQQEVGLLHYGYCTPEDRLERYQRYVGAGGHGENHVASIVAPATTKPWPARVPLLVREDPPVKVRR